MKKIVAAGALAAALAGWTFPAQAQTPSLLDPVLHGQLERWLGAGELQLDNIYTRQTGHFAIDFHEAADGKGDTFTLMRVSDDQGGSWLVGGYNPVSWSTTDGWHVAASQWERTAFIFNYTDPIVLRPVPVTHTLPSQGSKLTYNWPDHGPTFGQGPDLFVSEDLSTTLSWQLTYGDPAFQGRSIIDGTYDGQLRRIDALEVYSVAVIPEPQTWAMLVGGLGVLGWAARRRKTREGAAAR